MQMTHVQNGGRPVSEWRLRLRNVIFDSETHAGRRFALVLIFTIILSVLTVMLESVDAVRQSHGNLLYGLEWLFTLVFTLEYVLRIVCAGRRLQYATSFFGIVDLLAIIPTYIDVLLPGSHFLVVIRVLRVLRVFRVLKLVQYLAAARMMLRAIQSSYRKVAVFVLTVMTAVVILGSLMYVIETPENGFTSIPRSIYWAIVTITTVGYGDISPKTAPGQMLATIVMLLGFSIIAVPTGIVSAEISQAMRIRGGARSCLGCNAEIREPDAKYCQYCGAEL